jgi:hypothetical protein
VLPHERAHVLRPVGVPTHTQIGRGLTGRLEGRDGKSCRGGLRWQSAATTERHRDKGAGEGEWWQGFYRHPEGADQGTSLYSLQQTSTP